MVTEQNTTLPNIQVPTALGYEGTGRNFRVKRSIADDINAHGINAVTNLSSASLNQQYQKSLVSTTPSNIVPLDINSTKQTLSIVLNFLHAIHKI
jgi:hypothetical protein